MDKSPFQQYREAYEAMSADPTVQAARQEHRQAEAKLAALRAQHAAEEAPLFAELEAAADAMIHWEAEYRAAMDEAQAAICEAVISIGRSCTEFGVEATYSGGRKSVAWKAVAEVDTNRVV